MQCHAVPCHDLPIPCHAKPIKMCTAWTKLDMLAVTWQPDYRCPLCLQCCGSFTLTYCLLLSFSKESMCPYSDMHRSNPNSTVQARCGGMFCKETCDVAFPWQLGSDPPPTWCSACPQGKTPLPSCPKQDHDKDVLYHDPKNSFEWPSFETGSCHSSVLVTSSLPLQTFKLSRYTHLSISDRATPTG